MHGGGVDSANCIRAMSEPTELPDTDLDIQLRGLFAGTAFQMVQTRSKVSKTQIGRAHV